VSRGVAEILIIHKTGSNELQFAEQTLNRLILVYFLLKEGGIDCVFIKW